MKKRKTMVQKVIFVLVLSLFLSFTAGTFVIRRLQKRTTQFVYEQTQKLLEVSVADADSQIESIDQNLYHLIASDSMQMECRLLAGYDNTPAATGTQRVLVLETIDSFLNARARENDAVLAAGFIDGAGTDREVAIRQMLSLPNEIVQELVKLADEANGSTCYMDVSDATGRPYTLVMARKIMEKKNVSMRYLGTVYYFIDVNTLTDSILQGNKSQLVFENQTDGIFYTLSNQNKDLKISDEAYRMQPGEYKIIRSSGRLYFTTGYSGNTRFTYTLLTDYDALFRDWIGTFRLYQLLFTCIMAVTLVLGVYLARRTVLELRHFVTFIRKSDPEEAELIPHADADAYNDRDVWQLAVVYNDMSERIQELIRENYEKQLLVKETKLQSLRAQMNPHFLYNTLNSVYWMTKAAGVKDASEMISSLSELLRAALSDKKMVHTVDDEINLLSHYFVIQKYRYEDRLQVRFDVGEEVIERMIPSFSLQPLAENAIVYGLENVLGVCVITVRIFLKDNNLIAQVRNTGPAPEEGLMKRLRSGEKKPKGHGIGLMNIDQRIRFLYGDFYGVNLFREGDETVSQITIGSETREL